MPQLTYFDTEAPLRTHRTSRWAAVLRVLIRYRIPILIVMASYRLIGLGFSEMQQWDESIYALRAQTILQFGDLWDQSSHMLSGLYYSVHPPLYVWLSTSALLLLGDALWVYRLVSAFSAAALVFLLYRLSRGSMSTGRSLVVAGLFAFAPLPTFYSRQGQLDLLLTLCMVAALYFSWQAIRSDRKGPLVLAGISLGAALMTKFAFALGVPITIAVAAFFMPPMARRRAWIAASLMTLISLPLWLPWTWSMTISHGGGDPFWLFSPAMPLGATYAGAEGTVKETGMLFYFNQLIVQLSFLFPFAIYFFLHALFVQRRLLWTLVSVYSVLYLGAIWMMGSTFTVYLIPVLPFLAYAAVHGMALVRRSSARVAAIVVSISLMCFVWSLHPDWRVAWKDVLRGIRGIPIPEASLYAVSLLAAVMCLLLLLVWWLHRRRRLQNLLSLPVLLMAVLALSATTMYRIWIVDPIEYADGAEQTVHALRSCDAQRILLVGNGDNPQITWYLRGADIGWGSGEAVRCERMEPFTLGIETIRSRAADYADTQSVAVVIERDEIAQGVYLAPEEVLPRGYRIELRTRRYIVAGTQNVRWDVVPATASDTLKVSH